MSPFELVRAQLEKTVPFATFIGVKMGEISEGRASAKLDQRDEVSNHIGSMHAGAMFTLGEAASGAALAGTLLDRLMAVRPVAAKAEIQYLAIAKGTLTATGVTTKSASDIKNSLDETGKTQFDVVVDITDETGKTVATMTVVWHVKSLAKQ